jgi:hypothetical protein
MIIFFLLKITFIILMIFYLKNILVKQRLKKEVYEQYKEFSIKEIHYLSLFQIVQIIFYIYCGCF